MTVPEADRQPVAIFNVLMMKRGEENGSSVNS